MSKITGPALNRKFYHEDRPRALFSGMPIGPDSLFDYHVFFDDFKEYEANHWEEVKDASATVALVADAENGQLILSSQATTNDDGALIQADETNFLAVAGRELMFEARVKVSDADDCDMFVGLADTAATNPENIIAAGLARIGFQIADGNASILCVVDDDTSTTSVDSGVDASDATFVRLGFRLDNASIRFYVNRSLVATISLPTAIAAVTMGPAFFGLSGSASGTHTRTIDYIGVIQDRE